MQPIEEAPLLSQLRLDGRKGLTDLSRSTGIPVSTIFDRLKATTAILRHTCLLRFSALGFSCKALLFLRTTPSHKARLSQFLCRHPYINTVHKINNGYDLCAEGIFLDMGHLEGFMEHLEEGFPVKAKAVHFLLDELRREGFLTDPLQALTTIQGKAGHPIIK